MNKRKKVCIITLGCKVNLYESSGLAKALEDKGFLVSFSIEDADYYILNTCAVTNEAEKKSRGMIAKIRKVSNAPIYVCGCSAQRNPEKFASYEGVASVFGTSSKSDIVDLIIKNEMPKKISSEIAKNYQDNYIAKSERTRAVIKIQEGCNNFCSYCLIPYLRGRERSRELDSVKREVEYQIKNAKEIVFTGINLSNYGKDLGENIGLKDIAIMMRDYPKVRFRFSSLEQDIIDDNFLQILKDTKNFCPHFHLSLQSGADKTLKLMNRKYTSAQYYKKVQLIRKYFPSSAITTDIIVGFPSETEEDFIASKEFAKKCRFAKIHIFPYSVRSGTVASRMPCVATNVKERCKELAKVDKEMFDEYINSFIGKKVNIILETKDQNYWTGHSENYIKCYVEDEKKLKQNQLLEVEIVKQYKDGAIAKRASY